MKKRPIVCCAVLLILWICFAFSFGTKAESPVSFPEEGTRICCSGRICRMEYKAEQFYIYLDHISDESRHEYASSDKIQVILKKIPDCAIGNSVAVQGKVALPEPPSNDGQFDSSFYQRVNHQIFTLKNADIKITDTQEQVLLQFCFLFRMQCIKRLKQVFDEKDLGVLAAMLLGDKTYLTDEVRDCYQAGGISHILAISGLHISLLGMACYRLIRKCGISFFISSVLSGGLILLYVIFTGAGTSSVRAFLMFAVFLGAQCLGRTYDLLCALGFSAIVLLLSNPLLLFTSGFQMSFLAVAAIGGFSPVLNKSCGKWVSSGIALQLVMFPCSLWHSYGISIYSTLLNLIVIPFLPFVLAGSTFTLILLFFIPAAAKVTAVFVHILLAVYEMLCRWTSLLPFSQWIAGRPFVWAIILYYLILFAGGIWLACRKQKRVTYLFLVCAAILFLGRKETPAFSVTFLDVGQGDSIFLKNDDNKAMLCDGGSSSVGSVGRYRILPFLKYHGISRLEYVFLTHMDADHINGIKELLEMDYSGIQIKTMVFPELLSPDETYLELETLASAKGINIQKMQAGDKIRDGNLVITCLSPEKDFTSKNKNEQSLALHVRYQKLDIMLMGDLEKEGEANLIRSGRLEDFAQFPDEIEILKAGHHGSKGATSEELLRRLRPKLTILSYGKGNRYGHPSEETMKRLKKANCRSVSTEKYGEITISYQKNEKMIVRYGKNVIK